MKYKVNVRETGYLILYTVYIIALLGDLTILSANGMCAMIFSGMRYVCYALAVVKIIGDEYNPRQFMVALGVLLCVAATVLFSGNKVLGLYFLIILAAKDINVQKIIKITCYAQGICLAVSIMLSQLGVIRDHIFDPNTRARHGLGFAWATTAPILFFFFVLSYTYLRKEKIRIIELIVLELLNVWLFVMTNTRMSFYLASLLLAAVFALRFWSQNRTCVVIAKKVLISIPLLGCTVAFFIHAGYDSSNSNWNALNSLLSGRLALGYDGIQKYGITLFGQPIQWVGYGYGYEVVGTYNYVDCSYLQILLENGIVSLAIIIFAYMYIMYMAVEMADFYLQLVILFIIIFSITEPRLMNLSFNPFPILAAAFFSGNHACRCFQAANKTIPKIEWGAVHVTLKKRR